MKCKKHPKYKAIYPPRCDCKMCDWIYKLACRKRLTQQMRERWKRILKQRLEFVRNNAVNKQKGKGNMTKTKVGKMKSPSGKIYNVASGEITAFANRFKLDRTGVSKVLNGRRNSHKNWRRG
jgi:hypothetical protein